MSLATAIAADLQSIETDMGSKTLTWSGETYVCVPSVRTNTSMLEVGGFAPEAAITLLIRKALFTDAIYPATKQMVTYNGKIYRIEDVRQEATDTFLRLLCIDPDKGV